MLYPKAISTTSTPSKSAAATPTPTAIFDRTGQPIPLPPDKGAYLWDGKKLTLLIQSQVPSMGANVGRAALSAVVLFVKNKIELQLIGTPAQASFDHT